MKKYLLLGFVAVFLLSSGTGLAAAEKPVQGGFNGKARIYKGWLGYYDGNPEDGWLSPGTMNCWLSAKFSRDWNFENPEDSPVGSWCMMHFTWYSNEYDGSRLFGWNSRRPWSMKNDEPDADYKVKELMKIKKMSKKEAAEYREAGAYPASYLAEFSNTPGEAPDWLSSTYDDSSIPKFVIIQDTVEVYDVDTGELIIEVNRIDAVPRGLG